MADAEAICEAVTRASMRARCASRQRPPTGSSVLHERQELVEILQHQRDVFLELTSNLERLRAREREATAQVSTMSR